MAFTNSSIDAIEDHTQSHVVDANAFHSQANKDTCQEVAPPRHPPQSKAPSKFHWIFHGFASSQNSRTSARYHADMAYVSHSPDLLLQDGCVTAVLTESATCLHPLCHKSPISVKRDRKHS
jgi:hypothetical protein